MDAMSKVKRKMIKIDEEKCTGCGECVLSCAEGAMIIEDGKAKVVKDIYCDGLGACLDHCPEGALSIEEREPTPSTRRRPGSTRSPCGRRNIPATAHDP